MTARNGERTPFLIIPDVHQNIGWVRRVLAAEENWGHLVFLGDYFDPREGADASIADTCQFLLEVRRKFGGRVTFLLGNHDLQYLEAKRFCDHRRIPHSLKYQCGSAYTHAAAKKVAKGLPTAFWSEARLFLTAHGYLLSHAGLAKVHWPKTSTIEESLEKLEDNCASALRNIRGAPQSLLLPGICRGGDEEIGGITWLDWQLEFDDGAIPLPQVVGHTVDGNGARRRGRSWCLDGQQSTYAVLEAGELRVGAA